MKASEAGQSNFAKEIKAEDRKKNTEIYYLTMSQNQISTLPQNMKAK